MSFLYACIRVYKLCSHYAAWYVEWGCLLCDTSAVCRILKVIAKKGLSREEFGCMLNMIIY